ncbi:MAG: SpoVA/SpoVAEb family sporulation membrane protein, partial [Defluviitaleaceae bacterium]|nr:SpoVA/SpoVAEb family sporulation membrane protein [Defluviitaleaceae bacterium]
MQQTKQNKDRYQKMVNEVSPNSKTFTNCIKAFIIGGLICVFGQFLYNTFENRGFSKEHTSAYVVIILIF